MSDDLRLKPCPLCGAECKSGDFEAITDELPSIFCRRRVCGYFLLDADGDGMHLLAQAHNALPRAEGFAAGVWAHDLPSDIAKGSPLLIRYAIEGERSTHDVFAGAWYEFYDWAESYSVDPLDAFIAYAEINPPKEKS